MWTGSKISAGYGRFGSYENSKKIIRSHRFAYELMRGPIPSGLFLCHKCDVRACVNPDHLFLGDQQANMDDMVRKGREARGERVGCSVLREHQVREIKHLLKTPDRPGLRTIAAQYGVNRAAIKFIASGRTWRHVTLD